MRARAAIIAASIFAAVLSILILLRLNGIPRIKKQVFGRLRPLPQSPNDGVVREGDYSEDRQSNEWNFDHKRDGKNYGLSERQCLAAFPLLYNEIDRAIAYRRKVGNIAEDEIDPGWRGDGIVRAMIRNNELYIINANGVWDQNHRPRSLATLNSLNRAVTSYAGRLPDVEFTLTDHDSALIDENSNYTTLAYSRLQHQESLWLMPDFGFWGWPNVGLRSYNELRNGLDADEADFLDKTPKLVWRGAMAVAAGDVREALIRESEGQTWSDVKTLSWQNRTDIKENLLSMEDHCGYMFVAQTEGNTYSGRLKYLLNCHSIVMSHELRWIEHYHHLLHPSGSKQNYVELRRDFSDLHNTMSGFLKPGTLEEEGRVIADNARQTFRERYLTPAAEACYWRALIQGWASVQGFTPRRWLEDDGPQLQHDGKKARRKPRGTPFESYTIMEEVDWELPAKAHRICIDE